jgi:hypothetical protein
MVVNKAFYLILTVSTFGGENLNTRKNMTFCGLLSEQKNNCFD